MDGVNYFVCILINANDFIYSQMFQTTQFALAIWAPSVLLAFENLLGLIDASRSISFSIECTIGLFVSIIADA